MFSSHGYMFKLLWSIQYMYLQGIKIITRSTPHNQIHSRTEWYFLFLLSILCLYLCTFLPFNVSCCFSFIHCIFLSLFSRFSSFFLPYILHLSSPNSISHSTFLPSHHDHPFLPLFFHPFIHSILSCTPKSIPYHALRKISSYLLLGHWSSKSLSALLSIFTSPDPWSSSHGPSSHPPSPSWSPGAWRPLIVTSAPGKFLSFFPLNPPPIILSLLYLLHSTLTIFSSFFPLFYNFPFSLPPFYILWLLSKRNAHIHETLWTLSYSWPLPGTHHLSFCLFSLLQVFHLLLLNLLSLHLLHNLHKPINICPQLSGIHLFFLSFSLAYFLLSSASFFNSLEHIPTTLVLHPQHFLIFEALIKESMINPSVHPHLSRSLIFFSLSFFSPSISFMISRSLSTSACDFRTSSFCTATDRCSSWISWFSAVSRSSRNWRKNRLCEEIEVMGAYIKTKCDKLHPQEPWRHHYLEIPTWICVPFANRPVH